MNEIYEGDNLRYVGLRTVLNDHVFFNSLISIYS